MSQSDPDREPKPSPDPAPDTPADKLDRMARERGSKATGDSPAAHPPNPETFLARKSQEAGVAARRRVKAAPVELWGKAEKHKDDFEELISIQQEMVEAGLPQDDIDKLEVMIDEAIDNYYDGEDEPSEEYISDKEEGGGQG